MFVEILEFTAQWFKHKNVPLVTISTQSVFLLMALIDRWSTLAISTFIIQFNVYSSMWDKYKSTNHLFDDIIKNLIITTAVAKKKIPRCEKSHDNKQQNSLVYMQISAYVKTSKSSLASEHQMHTTHLHDAA